MKKVLVYASHLEGQTLNEAIPNYENTFNGAEGRFVLYETDICLERNNESRPDFEEVGIELKSTPLKGLRRFEAKTPLSMIDYNELAMKRPSLQYHSGRRSNEWLGVSGIHET